MYAAADISTILQTAISPAIIVSACGLLLLSMTNRLGRAVDRARLLVRDRETSTGDHAANIDQQLTIILRRSRYIRSAILSAAASILLTVLMILALFLSAMTGLDTGMIIAVLFILVAVSLAIAVVYFITDILASLDALDTEIRRNR